MEPTSSQSYQEVLLARYNENAEQARHHESLREHSTTMVAQTVGVMLGLVAFKEGEMPRTGLAIAVAIFITMLGGWGLFSSITFEQRARRHRDRIDELLRVLVPGFAPGTKTHTLNYVWIIFHVGIIAAGISLLIYICYTSRTA